MLNLLEFCLSIFRTQQMDLTTGMIYPTYVDLTNDMASQSTHTLRKLHFRRNSRVLTRVPFIILIKNCVFGTERISILEWYRRPVGKMMITNFSIYSVKICDPQPGIDSTPNCTMSVSPAPTFSP